MRWQGNRESENVEDARDSGGGGGFRLGGGSIGLGSVAVALVAGWLFGVNPLTILGLMSGGGQAPITQQAPAHQRSDDRRQRHPRRRRPSQHEQGEVRADEAACECWDDGSY